MLRYVNLGTNDIAAAGRFYDVVLGTLGLVRLATQENDLGYGPAGSAIVRLWVLTPYDRKAASFGNGSMLAFEAPSRAAVDAFHAAALAEGGTDEGAPGLRPYEPDFYACYVRDPDGNKLSAVHAGPA